MTLPHVLVADPPWKMRDQLPGGGRGAGKHYGLLSLFEIGQFPIPEMHRDSWLFLWRVASMQQEALLVAKAWGFTPKAEIVWVKRKPGGKQRIGMGHYVRNSHETCLLAVRGRAASLRLSASVPSVLEADLPRVSGSKRILHSGKPEEFFQLVERLVRGPYVEIFARRERIGWTCIGF